MASFAGLEHNSPLSRVLVKVHLLNLAAANTTLTQATGQATERTKKVGVPFAESEHLVSSRRDSEYEAAVFGSGRRRRTPATHLFIMDPIFKRDNF